MAGATDGPVKTEVVLVEDVSDEDKTVKDPVLLKKQDGTKMKEKGKRKRLTAEERKERDRLRSQQKRARRTAEQRERDLAKARERRQRLNENEEHRIKYNEKRRLKMLQETPEEAELRRAQRRERLKHLRASMTAEEKRERAVKKYFQKQALLAKLTEEELQERLRKNREYTKNYPNTLPPEKREAFIQKQRERCSINMKRCFKNRKTRDRLLTYMRNKTATETPEQRQIRLRRYKINAARRKLRQQLQEEGILSQEEIEKRLNCLLEEMKSEPLPSLTAEALSEYKPRLSGRKPKNNSYVELEEDSIVPRGPGRPPLWLRPLPTTTIDSTKSSSFTSQIQPERCPRIAENAPLQQSSQRRPVESTETTLDYESPPSPTTSPFDNDPCSPEEVDHTDSNVEYPPSSHNSIQSTESESCFNSDFPELRDRDHVTWKCPTSTCNKPMSSSAHLTLHFKRKHSRREVTTFLCMCCPWNIVSKVNAKKKGPSEFKTHRSLLQHVQKFHAPNFWPCPACNLLLYSETRYNSHFSVCSQALKLNLTWKSNSRSKKPEPTVCDACGKYFSHPRVYKNHMAHFHQISYERAQFRCPNCQLACLNSRAFHNHYVKCASLIPEPFSHSSENESSSSCSKMKLHQKSSMNKKNSEGPFPCHQCPKMFVQKCTLDDHIRRDHEGQSFICPDCGRNFQSAGKLWRHEAERHGKTDLPPPPGSEVLKCKYCNDFVMRGYEFHVKKKHPEYLEDFRLNEQPHVNKLLAEARKRNPKKCYKRENYNAFKSLVSSSSSDKVKCDFCSAVITQGSLKRHLMRSHPEQVSGVPVERNIQCPGPNCSAKFRFQSDYQTHYAEVHAFTGIEKIFLRRKFIRFTRHSEGLDKHRDARCLICKINLPSYNFSVRVHFINCHFQQVQEIIDV